MNGLDSLALIIALLAALGGWWAGFVRRIVSWAGLVVGVWVGTHVVPLVVGVERNTDRVDGSSFILAAAILIACAMAGQLAGFAISAHLRNWVARAHLGRADQVLGAVAGVLGVGIGLWILLPAMAQVPGWPAEAARESSVARWLHDSLGDPPSALDGLSRALGSHRFPAVFSDLGRSPEVEPPPADSPVTGAILSAAEAATVRISGPACGRTQSGSGVVIGDDLIATNAHVVAGTASIDVETVGGGAVDGEVIAFDPRKDIALVSAPGLGRVALPIGADVEGSVGVVLGFPGGGDLAVSPYRIDRRITAEGRDIYGRERVERRILVLGAELASGDSGGPLVTTEGEVVGLAFAVAPDQSATAYAIRPDDLRLIIAATRGREPVSVAGCTG